MTSAVTSGGTATTMSDGLVVRARRTTGAVVHGEPQLRR